MDADKQIKQMVNFILQEAKEKASEIYSRAEHDFHAEKQYAKMKILADIKQKQKDAETQRRITRSVVNAEIRMRKMHKREALVQQVKTQSLAAVVDSISKDQKNYEVLLKKLLVQAMIKLNESELEVIAREIDVRTVQRVLEPACREYEQLILEACGETVKMHVVLSKKTLPGPSMGDGTPSCAGGIKVSAKNGKVVLDNTVDSRLNIAFADLMPTIRKVLFTTSV
ncbi:hypothetical protein BASA81_007429 [Batrachochytrium salamandrivorans]|nr:hypothetical protein BASA81_007429 [Batrachochytrium salamandrivorans]